MAELNEKQSRKLTTKKEYTEYRSGGNIKKEHRIIGRDNWLTFVVDYFTEVSHYATETQHGIYVPKLGYFFNWYCPRTIVPVIKQRREIGDTHLYNFHTDMRMYIPTFLPARDISYWTMEKRFADDYKQRVMDKVKGGFRYKTYFSTLKKLRKLY